MFLLEALWDPQKSVTTYQVDPNPQFEKYRYWLALSVSHLPARSNSSSPYARQPSVLSLVPGLTCSTPCTLSISPEHLGLRHWRTGGVPGPGTEGLPFCLHQGHKALPGLSHLSPFCPASLPNLFSSLCMTEVRGEVAVSSPAGNGRPPG